MNAIQELWYGNTKPCESIATTAEEQKLTNLINRHQKKLLESVSESEAEILKKLISCYEEYNQITECHAFEIGFKLAQQLMK